MKRQSAAATLALLLLSSSPALAWDPFRERSDPPAPARDLDPAPFIAPPPGIYYVTDTYVADVVTSSGPLTTYSTATVHESTGSYARVLDTVGTGTSSAFDGSAFNGRRTLGDGRSVAGTYYENYAFIDGGFVPVSVVFFQDDAELARLRAIGTSPPAVPTPPPSGPTAAARPIASACCLAVRPPRTQLRRHRQPNRSGRAYRYCRRAARSPESKCFADELSPCGLARSSTTANCPCFRGPSSQAKPAKRAPPPAEVGLRSRPCGLASRRRARPTNLSSGSRSTRRRPVIGPSTRRSRWSSVRRRLWIDRPAGSHCPCPRSGDPRRSPLLHRCAPESGRRRRA